MLLNSLYRKFRKGSDAMVIMSMILTPDINRDDNQATTFLEYWLPVEGKSFSGNHFYKILVAGKS